MNLVELASPEGWRMAAESFLIDLKGEKVLPNEGFTYGEAGGFLTHDVRLER
jgi:hypothetical protein